MPKKTARRTLPLLPWHLHGWHSAARRRCDPEATPPYLAEQDEEVSKPRVPCGNQGRETRALGGLRPVRSRVPRRFRGVETRKPDSALPGRLVSSWAPVRPCVPGSGSVDSARRTPHDDRRLYGCWLQAARERCVFIVNLAMIAFRKSSGGPAPHLGIRDFRTTLRLQDRLAGPRTAGEPLGALTSSLLSWHLHGGAFAVSSPAPTRAQHRAI